MVGIPLWCRLPPIGYQAFQPYGYHAYGARPYYSHPGHYIGKREAEAAPEAGADPAADAWLTYGYGHPSAYSGLPYPYHNVLPTLKNVEKVEAKPITYTHHPYAGVNILQIVEDLSLNRIKNISLISHLTKTFIMGNLILASK